MIQEKLEGVEYFKLIPLAANRLFLSAPDDPQLGLAKKQKAPSGPLEALSSDPAGTAQF